MTGSRISRPTFTLLLGAAGIIVLAGSAAAQGRREHTQPTHERDPSVAVTKPVEVTITVAPVGQQALQTWVRTAGVIDASRDTLKACVAGSDAELVRPGQRVRSYPPDSKSSIFQARVTSVEPRGGCIAIEAALSGPAYGDATRFVMEIIVERGSMLAVANASIIERDGKEIVYEQIHPGHYEPHEIRTGLKGETYTEVLDGIAAGDNIVAIGSFFIDAEYRLKSTPGNGADAHQHH